MMSVIVCICFMACNKSQQEKCFGMRMNEKLVKNIVAEVQSLKETPDILNVRIADKCELIAIYYLRDHTSYTRLYNKDGEMVTEMQTYVEDIGPFVCGLSRIELSGTVAYMNTRGEVVIPPGKYEWGCSFWKDVAAVRVEDDKWGIIRKDGSELFPAEYEKAEVYPNGLIFLARYNQDKYEGGIFKADGAEVIPFQPMSVEAWYSLQTYYDSYLLDDVIIVKTESDGFCSINGDGKVDIIGNYYSMDSFDEHKVAKIMAINNACGFINAKGKLIIPCEYGYVRTNDYGILMCNKNGKLGIFDFDGNILWPFDYDDIRYYNNDLACVKQNNQWLVVDHNGNSKVVDENTSVFGKYYQTNSEDGYSHGLASITGEEILSPTHSWFKEIKHTRLVCAVNDDEYYNYDTGELVFNDYCQLRYDAYNSALSFDPDGYAIFSSKRNTDSKFLIGPDGQTLAFDAGRVGNFYVGNSREVYYKGKKVAEVSGFLEKKPASDVDYGLPFLDGIFVYAFDDKGKYTYFITSKGIIAKIDGYISRDTSCNGVDQFHYFFAWMDKR